MVAGLFFDLSRAFDCINYDFLLRKLTVYGIRGPMLKLLASYLNDRECYVKVGEKFSHVFKTDIGVPQGSVLGPLLFLLFINEMPECFTDGSVITFADDTSIVVSGRTPEELQISVKMVVDAFNNYCSRNNLILNVDKTVYINFKLVASRPSITVEPFKCEPSTKFLGTYIDESLNWQVHLNYVASKINMGYYAILRLKDTLPLNSLINAYYSMVYCHLSYNVILWGNCVNNSRILIAQKKVLRLLFNLKYRDSCKNYFIRHKILTFPCIFILKCLMYVKHNQANLDKNNKHHNYSTRNALMLQTENHRLTKFESSPNYVGTKLYNKLPTNFTNLEYIPFKREVKKLLISKAYYSIKEFSCDDLITN